MKIICIGRNYKEHAQELNNPIPSQPIFFLKPDTALLRNNDPFFYPNFTQHIDYECEIVVKINKVGKNIQEKFAHTYYQEISLGIDFTARDWQEDCKKKGLPWETAKAFDNSAVLSSLFIDKKQMDIQNIDFSLALNNRKVQQGNTSDFIFSIDECIAYISRFMTLKIGDLIYTGTPQGVGKVQIGDRLTGYIGSQQMFHFQIK